jgi:hypothetical protein
VSVSYFIGVSIPIAEWRCWRLWKISRYSKMAWANLILVRQRFLLRTSTWRRPQNDSMTALSKQSPTDPIDGSSPDWRTRRVNAHEVNWVDSIGRRNTGLLE